MYSCNCLWCSWGSFQALQSAPPSSTAHVPHWALYLRHHVASACTLASPTELSAISCTTGPSISSLQHRDSFAHIFQLLQQGKCVFIESVLLHHALLIVGVQPGKGGLLLGIKQLEGNNTETTEGDQTEGNFSPQCGSAMAGKGSTERRRGVMRAKPVHSGTRQYSLQPCTM